MDGWFPTQRGTKSRTTQFLHGPIIVAHLNMAANIDQIFQEFILNKIREIEVQNEDETYVVFTLVILFQNVN